MFVWPAADVLYGAGVELELVIPAMLLGGAGVALFNVWWETALAERIPPEKLSRVSSYDWMVSLGPALLEQVPNPYFGKIKSGSLSFPTVQRRQLLRPFPQFLQVLLPRDGFGDGHYNSFQLRVDKQYSCGLTLTAAYTNSKTMGNNFESATGEVGGQNNLYNPNYNRALSTNDIPQRLVGRALLTDLPIEQHHGDHHDGAARNGRGDHHLGTVPTEEPCADRHHRRRGDQCEHRREDDQQPTIRHGGARRIRARRSGDRDPVQRVWRSCAHGGEMLSLLNSLELYGHPEWRESGSINVFQT